MKKNKNNNLKLKKLKSKKTKYILLAIVFLLFGLAASRYTVFNRDTSAEVQELEESEDSADFVPEERFVAAYRLYGTFVDITEGAAPSGGYACADDIGWLPSTYRYRICSLKKMDVWSGSSFRPNNNIKRKVFASWLRQAQKYANKNYPKRVVNITTWTGKHGWGRYKFCDVTSSNTTTKQDAGIGFAKYHGIMSGYGCDFKPNGRMSYNGMGGILDRWDSKAD